MGGGEAQQVAFYGAPMVAAGPARVNISPEIFAKLAAGGQLTPDEMAQLSGQPAVGQAEQPASPMKQPSPVHNSGAAGVAGAAGTASGKKEKKDKSGSKKSLKASKKKKSKGCC